MQLKLNLRSFSILCGAILWEPRLRCFAPCVENARSVALVGSLALLSFQCFEMGQFLKKRTFPGETYDCSQSLLVDYRNWENSPKPLVWIHSPSLILQTWISRLISPWTRKSLLLEGGGLLSVLLLPLEKLINPVNHLDGLSAKILDDKLSLCMSITLPLTS